MLGRLLPRREDFFELFSQHAAHAVEAARLLGEMIDHLGEAEQRSLAIRSVEHEADACCQRTMELLHGSFITPIDRWDIHQLSSELDDIVDHIEESSQRLWLYEIDAPTPEAREMVGFLRDATRTMKAVVDALPRRGDAGHMRELCRAVKEVEKNNDRLLRRALARLFREVDDAKLLIKWKEIYDNIEAAIDRCEDVTNVIEGVVLEHT
jgi:predicted phosphate transport protein (TIGR00153 family)